MLDCGPVVQVPVLRFVDWALTGVDECATSPCRARGVVERRDRTGRQWLFIHVCSIAAAAGSCNLLLLAAILFPTCEQTYALVAIVHRGVCSALRLGGLFVRSGRLCNSWSYTHAVVRRRWCCARRSAWRSTTWKLRVLHVRPLGVHAGCSGRRSRFRRRCLGGSQQSPRRWRGLAEDASSCWCVLVLQSCVAQVWLNGVTLVAGYVALRVHVALSQRRERHLAVR